MSGSGSCATQHSAALPVSRFAPAWSPPMLKRAVALSNKLAGMLVVFVVLVVFNQMAISVDGV